MSDRIVIMTAHPGRIERFIDVDSNVPATEQSGIFSNFRGEILDLLHFAGRPLVAREDVSN